MIDLRCIPFALACAVPALALHPPGPGGHDHPMDEPPPSLVAPPALDEQDDDAPPSLDELLGIETDEDEATGADLAEEEAEAELSRRLAEEPLASSFAVAIQKMVISADQLDRAFDTGLGTQRVQEDILARLDHLIDEAKKQQNKSGSSSQSSSRQSQSQQNQPQPGPRPDQPQPGDAQQDQPTGESQEGEPPAPRDADPNTMLDESRAEWGTLPQRVRDMLLQGRTEKYSSLYEQLTREYYKRLAEEGS